MLLNDESHSFPEVISVLKRCLKCPQKLATDLTEFIDKEGRAVVKVGSYNVSHFLSYIFSYYVTTFKSVNNLDHVRHLALCNCCTALSHNWCLYWKICFFFQAFSNGILLSYGHLILMTSLSKRGLLIIAWQLRRHTLTGRQSAARGVPISVLRT